MNILDQKYLALLEAAPQDSRQLKALRACFSVLALAAAIDRDCAERLKAHDLSEGRFVVLVVLFMAEDPLAPHDLAERVGVTRATMTGLLDGLDRGGLIERRPDRRDRRSVKIALTATGRDLAARVNAEHSDWIAGLVRDLGEDDQAELQRLLARVWKQTDTACSATQPSTVPDDVHESR